MHFSVFFYFLFLLLGSNIPHWFFPLNLYYFHSIPPQISSVYSTPLNISIPQLIFNAPPPIIFPLQTFSSCYWLDQAVRTHMLTLLPPPRCCTFVVRFKFFSKKYYFYLLFLRHDILSIIINPHLICPPYHLTLSLLLFLKRWKGKTFIYISKQSSAVVFCSFLQAINIYWKYLINHRFDTNKIPLPIHSFWKNGHSLQN